MDALLGFLPLLVFLACPLVMAFCMFGMRRTGHSTESVTATTVLPGPLAEAAPAEQVAMLQARLAQLQAEQSAIATQIAELASRAQPAPSAVPPMSDLPLTAEAITPART